MVDSSGYKELALAVSQYETAINKLGKIKRKEARRRLYCETGKLMLEEAGRNPTFFNGLSIPNIEASEVALWQIIYGGYQETYTTLLGAVVIPRTPEEVSEKTGYDLRFVSSALDKMFDWKLLNYRTENSKIFYYPREYSRLNPTKNKL